MNPFLSDGQASTRSRVTANTVVIEGDDSENASSRVMNGERAHENEGKVGASAAGSGGERRVAVARAKAREPSAEERMNETAVAVIRASSSGGTSSGAGQGNASNGVGDDSVFSERLAAATAKIAQLGAQLKEKTAAAREGKMNQKTVGAKELLRRLQESAESQDARKVGGVVTVKSLRRGEGTTGGLEPEPGVKVNKTLGYKFNASMRRGSQKFLQSMGAAEKVKDTEFDTLWKAIKKQEQLLDEIVKTGVEYKNAQRAVFERGRKLSDLIRTLVDSGDKNNTWEGAPTVARQAAMKEAMKMCDISEALVQRCTPLTEEVFDWNIIEPASLRARELPAYKACVAKRLDYMRDMDAFERQLASMRKRPNNPKNADELSMKEEQTRRAKQRFHDFSTKLVEELTIVDGMRYEMAYSLVRGFANVSCFNLERQLDVARVLRGQ